MSEPRTRAAPRTQRGINRLARARPTLKQKASEGAYQDGEEVGVWTFYRRDGSKSVQYSYEYSDEDGSRNRRWTKWYESGRKLEEGSYKGGRRAGVWMRWYESGQKSSEGLRNGLSDNDQVGRWTWWRESGAKWVDGNFQANGERDGIWTYYDDDGEVAKTETYRYGRPVR